MPFKKSSKRDKKRQKRHYLTIARQLAAAPIKLNISYIVVLLKPLPAIKKYYGMLTIGLFLFLEIEQEGTFSPGFYGTILSRLSGTEV